MDYPEDQQKIAKRQMINLLRRKGTIITVVEGNNDPHQYTDDQGWLVVYGVTSKFTIQLAYKKIKQ